MLEGLDHIDWHKHAHAHGPATDIPRLLRGLAADDKKTRTRALSGLFNSITHQGGAYEATAVVVPFLIELLAEPSVSGKEHIVMLLADVARAVGGTDQYRAQARGTVATGTSLYIRLLADNRAPLRFNAPYLLAACKEFSDEIAPALGRRLTVEKNPKVKASLILALGEVQCDAAAELIRTLAHVLHDPNQDPVVRLAVALVVLEGAEPHDMPEALDVCVATMEACRQAFTSLPWGRGRSPADAVFHALRDQPNVQHQWVRTLLDHSDAALRTDALHKLKTLFLTYRSTATGAALLLGDLLTDTDAAVRTVAAMYLRDLGSAARLAAQPLLAAIHDPSDQVRPWAIEALGTSRDDRAVPEFLRILASAHAGERDVISVLRGLEMLDAEAMPALLHLRRLAKQRDGDYAWHATRVLGAIGPEARAALPELKALLHDSGSLNVQGAALALGRWGPAAGEAVSDLMDLLAKVPDPSMHDLRPYAAQALGQIGPAAKAAVPSLVPLLESPCAPAVALALWQIDGRADLAIPVFDRLLRQTSIRNDLFDQIGSLGPAARPLVPLLHPLHGHAEHRVRVRAACALWQIEHKVDDILSLLLDAFRATDFYAAFELPFVLDCLGDIGPPARDAIRHLRELIDTDHRIIAEVQKDEALQNAARRALQRILV